MKNVEVLKFGGSSLSSPERILQVAQIIAQFSKESGSELIVVVSAMGQSTNQLLQLASEVSADYQSRSQQRELDMLLSTGERVSMALLSMALSDLGLQAVSFTGSQSGIITSSFHGEARIEEIRPIRIQESLSQSKIVIVAGFQGVSPQKEITTLGRGGSDTSAVALAAAFNAKAVWIFTDVDGFFSADPRKVPQARRIPQLSAREAYQASLRGAKVLHPRCIAVAFQHRLEIRVLSSFFTDKIQPRYQDLQNNGSLILPQEDSSRMEKAKITCLQTLSPISLLQINGLEPEETLKLVEDLQNSSLRWVSLRSFETGLEVFCEASFTQDFCQIFKPQQKIEGLCLLSLVGTGLTTAHRQTQQLLARLKSAQLPVLSYQVQDGLIEVLIETPQSSIDALLSDIHNEIVESPAS